MSARLPVSIVFLAVLSLGEALAEVKGMDVRNVTVEEAARFLAATESPGDRRDFASMAVRAGRMDLAAVCFEFDIYAMREIRDEVRRLPDSSYKDELVLMMLNSDSRHWGPDERPEEGSRPPPGVRAEPFASVAKKHFVPFEPEMLLKRAKRRKLAADLEAAIAGEKRAGAVPSVKSEGPVAVEPPPNASVRDSKGSAPMRSEAEAPNPRRKLTKWTAALTGAGVVAVVLMAVGAMKYSRLS